MGGKIWSQDIFACMAKKKKKKLKQTELLSERKSYEEKILFMNQTELFNKIVYILSKFLI